MLYYVYLAKIVVLSKKIPSFNPRKPLCEVKFQTINITAKIVWEIKVGTFHLS